MRCGPNLALCLLALSAAFATAVDLGLRWEKLLVIEPVDGMITYAQGSSEDETTTSNGARQNLSNAGGKLSASYSFTNFNRDKLTINFSMDKSEFSKYEASFGYYKKDISEIEQWHRTARDSAFNLAVKAHKSQSQLDAAIKAVDNEKKAKINEYMASRGFRLMPGNVVTVDVPSVVKRNGPILNSLAQAFDSIGQQRHYGSDALIGAVTSMVQTGVIYKIPPDVLPDGKHTGGLNPPASTLLKGWGDCDTKTALISSIFANWPQMRMVGVSVPGHYLMGVLRIPNKGDAFVEFQGLQYVLIEPAGPAWLPLGQVASSTVPLLESTDGFRIDPMFSN